MWSRVAGDVLDTAVMGAAAKKTNTPGRFALLTGVLLAIGAADATAAGKLTAA